jgi:hypothetical protein
MKPCLAIVVAILFGSLVLAAGDASAVGPVDIEAGATASFGTNPASSPPNPLGFGLGARAGASMLGFYAGADVAYYFGSSTTTVSGYRASDWALKAGGDLGYDFKIATVIVRPRLGVGDLIVTSNPTRTAAPCQCNIVFFLVRPSTHNDLYIEGGLTALVPMGMFFVATDADFLVVPNPIANSCCDELETAFTFDAQTGIRF